jgi:hypothetical protein
VDHVAVRAVSFPALREGRLPERRFCVGSGRRGIRAALDGDLVVTTCGSNDTGGVDAGIDAVLSFHTACPGTTANESAANDDDSGGYCGAADQGAQRDAVVELRVASGQTVWIRVSRYSDSSAENFELGVSFHAIPGSDF